MSGALILAFLAGCQSRPPASEPSGQAKPKVLRAGQRWNARLLGLSPEDERQAEAHARFAAGVVAEYSDDPEGALVHFKAAIAQDPDNEELTLDVARKLIELRRLPEARQLLEQSARRPHASGLVCGLLGTVCALQNDSPAAIAANRQAIERTPQEIAAYHNLAQIYLEAGQVRDALDVLDVAANQPDTDSTFLIVLADSLGQIHQLKQADVGDLRPRILALLDRAASREPQRPVEVLRLADLYQLFGEGTKSLPLYQRLLETAPDLPGLRERLTDVYLRIDDREKAAEQLRILARDQPTNPLPHYYLGVIALEARRYEEAISAFNQVLILRPQNPAIYFDLAVAHLSHQRPQDALAILDRARAQFRPSFRLEFYSAAALTELKRYEEAIRHFTAAEVIAGATEPAQLTALFFFQSGIAYERAKRYDDAAVQFERALELKPDFAEALNYLGYMWAEQGTNLERAHGMILKAVELEPNNPAFLDSLAWVLHQLGRSQEALPHQIRAVELSTEPDAVLYEHLGDIYDRLGRRDEAREAWRRSLKIEAKPELEQKLKNAGD